MNEPRQSQDSLRRWKKRKNPWGGNSMSVSLPVSSETLLHVPKPKPVVRQPVSVVRRPGPYGPVRYLPENVIVVIPEDVVALPFSATPVRNPDLLRQNYAVVMKRMFFTEPKQEGLVEIQMIKKPRSFLNVHFAARGRVILPVFEVPVNFTVWVRLDSRRIIRVPLDHFHIVN